MQGAIAFQWEILLLTHPVYLSVIKQPDLEFDGFLVEMVEIKD